jgi:Uma2 family endonuclease
MVLTKDISTLPRTLEEFMAWEPEDGSKYEWNDGELIKFVGMNRKQVFIYEALNQLFIEKGLWKTGTLISEYDVQLCGTPPAGIQMRRPDVAYLTKEQIALTKQGEDEIPEFAIEIISGSDKANKVEEKIIEYFKHGVKVLWLIYPDNKTVQVYTSLKQAQICTDDDICSAKPVLEDFEIKVSDIFA